MATSNGPVQNHGQIQWVYTVSGVSQGSTHVTITATAYYMSVAPYSQYFNGSKSWSGAWGSGSGAQAYNLAAGVRVAIVSTSGVRVALTDAKQTRSFSVVANHYFGTTSHTLTVSIPARYARTPSGLTITRNSDTSHRLNWTRNSTYTAVVIQRSVNGGAWAQVARPSGNAYTWTDTTTKPGNKYDYRVAGVGGSGQSGWSNTATVYTSPLAPTGVTATRVSDNIRVDASGKSANATAYNVRDGSTTVATGVSLPWTHASPNPAQTHQYTVQATRGSLMSPWSSASNVVQLQSPPLAPTDLRPNGGLSVSDELTRFMWKHSPVDSSEQTVAEFRRRAKGATSWGASQSVTAEQHTQLLDAGDYEWQVRTKGAHPDFGPWSAIATVTVIDRPGVAINDPGELWTRRTVTVQWDFAQAQGRPQSSWEAQLLRDGEVLETRAGSGGTSSAVFITPLVDTETYEVSVRAASGDVWSFPGVQSFLVQVPPAAPADMDGVWSEESGAVTINVQDGRGEYHEPVTNHFTNPSFVGDGTWVEIARNLVKKSTVSDVASNWTVNGTNFTHAATDGGRSYTAKNDVTSVVSLIATPTADIIPFPASTDFAYLFLVRNDGDKPVPVMLEVYMRKADASSAGSANGGSVTLAPGEEVSLVASGTTSAEAVDIRASLRTGGSVGTFPAGGVLTVFDGMTLLKGTQTPLGRICGSVDSPDPDMRVRWLGATSNSETALEGERVATTSISGCVGIRSTLPDGRRAIRVISQAEAGYFGLRGTVPGTSTTGLITVYREEDVLPAATVTLRTNASPNETAALVRPSDFPPPGEVRDYRAFNDIGPGAWIVLRPSTKIGGSIWYAGAGLFEGVYAGPAFSGSSGLVKVGDTWMSAAWDGSVDDSTSTLTTAPAAVSADVERSIDGGETWQPFIAGAEMPFTETDTESLSNGVTLYRVTTYSIDGAASVVIHEVAADSTAAWLSGGDGFTRAQRLPYDPAVTITAGRERVVRQYAGRATPVVHAGEAVTRTLDYGGTLITDEHSPEDLADLVSDPAPVHLYRDPDGRHIYGALGTVQLERHAHMLWGFSFQLTETEH